VFSRRQIGSRLDQLMSSSTAVAATMPSSAGTRIAMMRRRLHQDFHLLAPLPAGARSGELGLDRRLGTSDDLGRRLADHVVELNLIRKRSNRASAPASALFDAANNAHGQVTGWRIVEHPLVAMVSSVFRMPSWP